MRKKILLPLLFLAAFAQSTFAQVAILHGNDDTVNYTHVMFEVPHHPGARSYEITIADNNSSKFALSQKGNRHCFLITGQLNFGHTYNWKYTCFDHAGKAIFISGKSTLHIRGNYMTEDAKYRNKVTVNNKKAANPGLIVLDNGTIIDRDGNFIWTFPADTFGKVRCLDFNEDGNITFIWNGFCYETDLRANTMWKSPESSGGYALTDYHHEFKKLDNGNYLCMARRIKPGENTTELSIVFEVDRDKDIKWIWDEKEYYSQDTTFLGAHLNAAYYDTKTQKLYISNRDLSSIAKINTANGTIEYSIGYDYKNLDDKYYPNSSFSQQHAVSLLPDGGLMLFNNGGLAKNRVSSVVIMSQPTSGKPPVVQWEYPFNFDDPEYNYVSKCGDAQLLPNGNILVCMGANNRTIEVTRDKKIVWQADTEMYDTGLKAYRQVPTGYRGDFTPSLYPCYFTAYTEGNKLVIENAGTEEDRYTCHFTAADGIEEIVVTKNIAAGATTNIPLPLERITISTITVRSERNNRLVKVLQL